MVDERIEETAKERQKMDQFDPSDMSLDAFKKAIGSQESRNVASRSNKPIASQLAKGASSHGRNQVDKDDSDDDDDILGRARDDDDDDDDDGGNLRQSFGKRGGGLAQMKAKLSL